MSLSRNQMAPSAPQALGGQGVLRISVAKSLSFGSVNVGTMVGRSKDVVEMLSRRNIGIVCCQATRWKGNSCRTMRLGNIGYKFYWSADDSGHARHSNKRAFGRVRCLGGQN